MKVGWFELYRVGDNSYIVGMNGGTALDIKLLKSRHELEKFFEKHPDAENIHVAPEGKELPTVLPNAFAPKKSIASFARECARIGRRHAPDNEIDRKVLDPLRPTMKRLGQMSQHDDDGFYNWCAAWVTYILRELGCKVPDQPIVKGRPFWATVALVETWKAWAIDKGAWRPSTEAEPGDIVIYDWDKNGVTDHIGIILELRHDGLVAAEGNKANREDIIYRSRTTIAGTIDVEKLFS